MLRAARLVDGSGSAPIANGVVVVTGNRITAVGRSGAVTVPAGAQTIDLGDATLLPGFIDPHTHIIGRILGDPGMCREREGLRFVRRDPGGRARLRTLMAGFTTIRVVGSDHFDDFALRKAITRMCARPADADRGIARHHRRPLRRERF